MKNIFLKTSILLFVTLFTISCSDTDKPIDALNDGTTSGAVLRTIENNANMALNPETFQVLPGESINILVEIQDVEGGALAERIDVFLSFEDRTNVDEDGELTGENDIAEQMFTSIAASEFIQGERLPRAEFNITIEELESFFNITNSDYTFIDKFITRFELVLTDGRVFTNTNANEETVLGVGFFNSPFRYTSNLFCPVGESFTGEYTVTQTGSGVLGIDVWDVGTVVDIIVGESEITRRFDVIHIPQAGVGQPATAFRFDLICGSIIIQENQGTGLTCGGAGLFYGPDPTGAVSVYDSDTLDDSILELTFTDNSESDCGEDPRSITVILTKNE